MRIAGIHICPTLHVIFHEVKSKKTRNYKMAFNLTGIDEDSYFIVSSAVNVSLFFTTILIPLLLCLLCVVALALATAINLKVKVLLMNIFAVEVCSWLRYTVFYLGFPARILQLPGDYSCHVFYSLFTTVLQQKFTATAFYAIMVFVFIKYGEKKLKWRVIIPMITLSWIVTIATSGTLPYASDYGHQTINGFCILNPSSSAFIGFMSVIMAIVVICLIITAIFCILIFVYIKKNIIEENAEVKKAVSKVVFYLLISSVLSFITNVIPMLNPVIKKALAGRSAIDFLTVHYLFRVIFNLPAIATPIVSIILLKPIRIALRRLFCACYKHTTPERN